MHGARLLVIDDSPTIRKLVELTLRGTTWTVAFAPTGREGIASALASPPDLIVLDYVLPDIRGIDVCTRLAGDATTRDVPIVVITAKSDQVKAQFEPFASVMACLPKPFTGEQLQKIAAAAIADRGRTSASTFTREQKESAAQTLFARLRGALANVPQWAADVGAAPPAPYFARKLLTAERVEAILEGLLPLYRDALASQAPVARAPEDGAAVRGALRAWPLRELLNFFAASGRAGELTITEGDRALLTYWRDGEIVLVTTRDPDDWLRGLTLGRSPPAALARAKAEQRASGRPAVVTLAEDGVALPGPLADLLHRQGRRLLLEAMDATSVDFAWRDLAALPLYVEAHGRHVSTARNTLILGAGATPSPASSLEQLALERLRRDPPNRTLVDGAVLDRVRGFTARIRQFALDPNERRVLAVTDGVQAIADLAARVALPIDEVRAIFLRLAEVGLVAERGAPTSRRPVLILEPDVEGFQRPLETLLRHRAVDAPVVSLDDEHDILGAIRRERPRLVILNAATMNGALEETARAVRASRDLAGVSLVAVLESEGVPDVASLRSAGFDAVFVKPVPYADLERLID